MLYIFSQDDKYQNIITEETGLIDTWFKDYQNHLIDEPFKFHVESDSDLLPLIKDENQVAFYDRDNRLRLMRIKGLHERSTSDGYIVEVKCEPSFLELYDHFVEDRRINNGTAQSTLNAVLQGSRYIGAVTVDLGNQTTNFYWINGVDAIFKIIDVWGGALVDTITLDENNEIIERKIIIQQRLGADNGLLIEPDYNAESIERSTLSYPVTAMYGQGASLETDNGGYTRYITFEDVEWKVSNGDPVDKPKGQKWVGDPQALQKYGYLHNNQRMHRFGHFSNQEYETAEDLLMATWQALQEAKHPEVNHEATITVDRPVSLGDTATIIDRNYNKPIEVQSQITGLEYDILEPDEQVKVVLGKYVDMNVEPWEKELDDIKQEVSKPRPTKPIDNSSYPDVKPGTPTNVQAIGSFQVIQLYWDYDSNVYVSHYEVYASKIADFVPDSQYLIYRGRVSAFGHEVQTDEMWYYRIRAVNTRGTPSDYSAQVSAASVRINTPDIMFGGIIADHLENNLDIAEKLAQNTIDKINQGPMQEIVYTQQQIEATEEAILNQLNSQIGDVNSAISSLLDKTNGLEGTVTNVEQRVDTISGELQTTITELSNIDGVVSQHTLDIQANAAGLSAKAEKSEVYTKTEVNTRLNTKVETTVYNNKVGQLDVSINNITSRVSNTETNINGLTGEVNTAKSQIGQLEVKADQVDIRVSEIQTGISNKELTRKLGIENINRSYERNLSTTDRPLRLGTYSLIDRGGEKVIYNNGVYSLMYSEFIPNVKDAKHYVDMDVLYEGNTQGTVYIQLLFYNKNKTEAGSNGLAMNFVGAQPVTKINEWQKFSGYIDMSEQSATRKNAYYVVIRVLVRYTGVNEKAYIRNLSWKQMNSQSVAESVASITTLAGEVSLKASQTSVNSLTGRMSTAETTLNLLPGQLNAKVNKNGVISEINATPESIRIASKLIHLSGTSQIDDAVIGTAAIANAAINRLHLQNGIVGTLQVADLAVTGAKIAKLAVDDSHIANLSAVKITTGTLQGIVITGNTINGGTINGAWIYSDGERGMVRINNGGISATDMRVLNNGTFFSEDGYVTLRAGGTNASTSHVYLQSAGEVRATKQQQYTSYINVRANQFLAESTFYSKGNAYLGDVNTVFGSNNGYTVVRSISNSFVYLQGSEIRATTPTSNTSYVDLRAKQFTAESTFYSKGNAYLSDNNGVFGSNNGYVILRSVSNSFVYLQGTEIRATSPASTTTYADMRAKQIFAESTFYSKGNGYVGDNNTVFSSNNGYTVLRSVSNDAIYLQGNEVRATRAGDAGTYIPVRASSFPTGSLAEYKQDIEVWEGNALDIINRSTIYEYRLKSEFENGINRKRQGLVIGSNYKIANEFIDGDGVEQYLINSISLKAIQELDVKVYNIEKRLDEKDLEMQYLKQKVQEYEKRIKQLEERAA